MTVRRLGERGAGPVCAATLPRLLAGLLLAGLLAGCGDTSPSASLRVGDRTVATKPAAWCTGDGTVARDPLPDDCERGPRIADTIEAAGGTKVDVVVDPEVARDGWAVTLLRSDGEIGRIPVVARSIATRFTMPTGQPGDQTYLVEVIALRPGEGAGRARGLWRFRIDSR